MKPNSLPYSTGFSRKIAAGILFAVLMAVSRPISAQEPADIKVVTVIGTASIYKDNLPAARDRAISNSLVSAIARAAEDVLPLDAMVLNFKTVNRDVYSHASQFIKDYKVLKESAYEGKYRIIVRATVAIGEIRQRLLSAGFASSEKVMPKILFLVSEQSLESILPLYWWGEDLVFVSAPSENAMASEMRKKNFSVIDHVAMVQNHRIEPLNYDLDLTTRDAVVVGMQLQADVVVLGKAITEKMPNVMGSNLQSFKGDVTVRAVRADTGEEIASISRTVTVVNTDEIAGSRDALRQAALLAGNELATQIANAWLTKEMEPGPVEILVEGTRYLGNFVMFRKKINELSGVNSLQIKEFQSDNATLVVDFNGNAKAFAKALMLKTFDTFGVTISEISENKLRVELVPK